MTGLAKNTAAMNRAGAACGCGALIYLAARSLLTRLASLLLALRVPGASLQNPAGASQLEAALLRIGVSGLALAAPFLLLAVLPLPRPLPLGRGARGIRPRLFLFFWGMMLAGNLLAGALVRATGPENARVELPGGGMPLAAAFAAVCLLPAVGEELLFRGLLQGWLRPFGAPAAVLGQAVLFALLHGRLSACVAALLGGVALGLCAEWSGSLRPGMWFHLYNNVLAFTGQYASQYASPETGQLVSLAVLLGGPLAAAAVWASGRAGGRRARVNALAMGKGAAWPLGCPGWVCSALFLLALSLWQTFV